MTLPWMHKTLFSDQGRQTGGKSGTDYQGPNGGGGPWKAWNKNVVFTLLISK